MEDKPEGDIGIKNLSIVKHSLMAKHVFKYLNRDNVIWVDILRLKYGYINFWKDTAPHKCSWFFRSLYYTAFQIKPFCKLNSINPDNTSFLWDPWCFDIPITYKPTYINMEEDLLHANIFDLLHVDRWSDTHLNHLFGPSFNKHDLCIGSIDNTSYNHWIWSP